MIAVKNVMTNFKRGCIGACALNLAMGIIFFIANMSNQACWAFAAFTLSALIGLVLDIYEQSKTPVQRDD